MLLIEEGQIIEDSFRPNLNMFFQWLAAPAATCPMKNPIFGLLWDTLFRKASDQNTRSDYRSHRSQVLSISDLILAGVWTNHGRASTRPCAVARYKTTNVCNSSLFLEITIHFHQIHFIPPRSWHCGNPRIRQIHFRPSTHFTYQLSPP